MAHSVDAVLQFEHAINSHDADAISALMTPDVEFIDSLGTVLKGADKLRAAWAGYFKMFPDYFISHTEIFAEGNTVAIFGAAQGTLSTDGEIKKEISGRRRRPGEPWSKAAT